MLLHLLLSLSSVSSVRVLTSAPGRSGERVHCPCYDVPPPRLSPERIQEARSESGRLLSVANLRSHDSGNYSCGIQLANQRIVLKSFILFVRPPDRE